MGKISFPVSDFHKSPNKGVNAVVVVDETALNEFLKTNTAFGEYRSNIAKYTFSQRVVKVFDVAQGEDIEKQIDDVTPMLSLAGADVYEGAHATKRNIETLELVLAEAKERGEYATFEADLQIGRAGQTYTDFEGKEKQYKKDGLNILSTRLVLPASVRKALFEKKEAFYERMERLDALASKATIKVA